MTQTAAAKFRKGLNTVTIVHAGNTVTVKVKHPLTGTSTANVTKSSFQQAAAVASTYFAMYAGRGWTQVAP